MQRFSFKVGLTFIEGQRRWQIRRRLPTGKVQLESEAGEIVALTDAELRNRWHSRNWLIDEVSLGSLARAVYLTVPRDLTTYPENQQREARRRKHYLDVVKPADNHYHPERWRQSISDAAALIKDPYPPAPLTVQRWWRRFRTTKSLNKLIPHNRASSNPRGKRRYQIFEEAVATVLMTNQQLPTLALAEEVFRRIDALNAGNPDDGEIARPSLSTIYRWVGTLQQDLIDHARLGADATRQKYRAALGDVKVSRILERFEIDHTPLDLIVIDKLTALPLGRPWVTMTIDRFSRLVVGFYVSFNAPSSHGVLQCLRRAILPKDDWLARFQGVQSSWPACGIPELIAVDNGTDLHSDALEATCQELGIQILFCGSKTPQHKGAIERFFRTMNTGLIHRLPGTVFSNVDERGDYPSEEMAVIDMEALVHLLTKWVVDVYNVTTHRGIGSRPLDRWLQSAERSIVELPVNPEHLEVITGIPEKRTLFHYGVELDGLQYNSELLQTIRRRAGGNILVALKYYEDSVGHIHVFEPHDKEYIKVPSTLTEYAHDLPREMHRLIRAHVRKKFGDHCQSPQLLQARAEIEALVANALHHKKMRYRKAGASCLMHDSEAVLLNTDPLREARKPSKPVKDQPPADLPSGLEDVLPDLSNPPAEV